MGHALEIFEDRILILLNYAWYDLCAFTPWRFAILIFSEVLPLTQKNKKGKERVRGTIIIGG